MIQWFFSKLDSPQELMVTAKVEALGGLACTQLLCAYLLSVQF